MSRERLGGRCFEKKFTDADRQKVQQNHKRIIKRKKCSVKNLPLKTNLVDRLVLTKS